MLASPSSVGLLGFSSCFLRPVQLPQGCCRLLMPRK